MKATLKDSTLTLTIELDTNPQRKAENVMTTCSSSGGMAGLGCSYKGFPLKANVVIGFTDESDPEVIAVRQARKAARGK